MPQLQQVNPGGQDVLAVQQEFAGGFLVAVKLEDAVVDAQVGGFAAAAGADDGGDAVGVDIQVVLKEGLVVPVIEVQIAGGYLNVDSKGSLTLTETGAKLGKKIYERHTVLTKYLVSIGVDEQTADEDACKIEHIISDKTFEAFHQFFSGSIGERVTLDGAFKQHFPRRPAVECAGIKFACQRKQIFPESSIYLSGFSESTTELQALPYHLFCNGARNCNVYY